MLTAAQLVALCRRATGAERAAVYAAIVGSARCEHVTLETFYDGTLRETSRGYWSPPVSGWAEALTAARDAL
jgi:hypothetical protein